MAVALQSLRVTADFDASGYARGAALKVDADAQMIASDKARNASIAQADAAMAKAIPGYASLSKSLLQGYSAGQQFEQQIRRVGNAVDQGLGLDRAAVLLDAAYRKFGLVSDASLLAKQGFVSIVPVISEMNNAIGVYTEQVRRADLVTRAFAEAKDLLNRQAANQSAFNAQLGVNPSGSNGTARASADAFLAEFGGLDGVAAAKAQQIGKSFTDELNSRLVGGVKTSARASSEAFVEMFNQMDAIAAARAEHFAQQVQLGWSQAFNMSGGGIKSAEDSASVFQAMFAAEEAAAKGAADLRAQLNPLENEMVVLGKQMANYRQLLNAGVISTQEFEQANVLAAKRLSDVDMNLRKAGTAGRVMSGEMANLGYQVNDVITGIMLGQSPFMIFAQQGGQIYQIFQHSKAGIGDFASSAMTWFGNLFTVGRVAFLGIAAAIGISTVAADSFLSAQQKVGLALTGAGRGSGASVGGIGNIAQQGSSTFGLSVSEARELGTALAATGKVANENILPIVKMGKDIQHSFGIDATEATKMLAEAFADPAKGAETLNQRLGFLDAGTKRNIDNLVAQNRVWDAQKVLLQGVKSGLDGVDESIAKSSKFWTLLGNAISNAWGSFGEFIARGLGGFQTLEERIERTKQELADLRSGQSSTVASGGDLGYVPPASDEVAIAKKSAELDKLTAAYERNATATAVAQAAQRSFLQESTVRSVQADIAEREKLNNSLKVLQDLLTSIGNDEAAGARLAALGVTMKQISDAVNILSNNLKTFKTDFESSLANLKISNDAITAFTTAQKGQIAYQQSIQSTLKSNMTDTEKFTLAQQAQASAIKQAVTAITEAGRARELTARQAVDSTNLDIKLIGESVGKQAELRANLQARQALEQQASARHEQISAAEEAEFERLKKANAEFGKRKQIEAEISAASQANFALQTVFLSDTERQIAAVNFQLHGNKWKDFMGDGLSATMRLTDNLKVLSDAFSDVGKAAFSAALSGANGMNALVGALDGVAKKLSDKAFDNLLSGNPEQMAVGLVQAGASALISAFTKDEKNSAALKKAQDEWAKAGPAFQSFLKQMSGGVTGSVSQAISDAAAREASFEDQAWKARDTAAINAARAGIAKFTQTQKELFNATFDASLAGLNDGLGLDSPFMKSVANIKTALTNQLAFIDDTDTARGGRAVDIAKQASQSYLLSLLQQPKALSAVQTGMMQIQGSANALQGALVQLGMTSGDAAKAINDGVTKAMASLKTQFEAGLTERLNTANGQSFINDATKLIAQHQQDLLDAASLGTDPALVAATFKAEAQQIVDSAELLGDKFAAFKTQFPELADVVHEFTQSVASDAKALQDAQNSAAKNITDYLAGLQAGPSSTQSPIATLASAQTLYQANLPLAQAGNVDAQNKFVSLADNLEKAARVVYASGQGYQDIRNQIINQGLSLPAVQATTDPVTQAVRDAIAAIQIGNTALSLINTTAGGTTSAVNASNSIGTLTQQILPAVNAGNAANVAAALSTYFNAIDPSGKLASIITTTGVTAQNAANVNNSVDQVRIREDTNIGLASTANSLVSASNNFLTAINSFADRIIQAINAQGVLQQNIGNSLILNSAILLNWMPKLVTTGKESAGGDGGGVSPSFSYTAHATGGVIPPYGIGLVSEHSPGGGQFIKAGPDPITVSPYAPLPSFRGSSDNSNAALLKRIDKLTAEVEKLQKIVAAGDRLNAEATMRSGDAVVDAVENDTKKTAEQMRMNSRNQRAA